MAKRKEGEISPSYILWTHSANNAGLHPVKVRVTHQRQRHYYQILSPEGEKIFLSVSKYNSIVSTPLSGLRGENRRTRNTLEEAVTKAREAIRDATNNGRDPFSFGEFERKYLGEEAGNQFLKFFATQLKSLEAKGQAGTNRVYGSVFSSFGKFLNNGKSINNSNFKDIDPASITPQKLADYEDWLKQQGSSDTWVSICMRSIRAIYNRLSANDDYLKLKYPFSKNDHDGGYKIPISTGQKGMTMTKEEIKSFISGKVPADMSFDNPLYRAKMLLLFSFFAQGVNFKDLALLKYSDIRGNNIEFERQKTIRTRRQASAIRIPITKELNNILIEIGNPDKSKNAFVFSVFDANRHYTPKQIDGRVLQFVKTTNKWLKKYCEFNKLPIITTYSARHTFASLAKVHLPLAQISQMLGHTRIETTQVYLGRFADEENKAGLVKVFKSIKGQK